MYTFTSTVRYSECDTDSRLTLPSIINYLQDCSTFHTEHVGRGVAYLAEHHYAWFITNWHIQIVRQPRFMEPIVVGTWCPAMGATNARRNFVIRTQDGQDLVRADSIWVAFDTQAQRPMRVPKEDAVYLSDDEPLDMPPLKRKIRLQGEGDRQQPIVVTEQNIDTNHHVNNGQYVYMADRLVHELDEGFSTSWLQVQYKTPAKLGDTMVPYLHVEEGGYAVDLTDGQGNSFAIVRMIG